MIRRTGQQMVSDMIFLLKQTELAGEIRGKVYRDGTRPRDSAEEDMVVIFTEGDAEQFQSATITVNIYVPDLPTSDDGVLLSDSARCEELEECAARSVESLKNVSCYRITLRSAIYTEHDDEINQSFVVIRLRVRYFD